MSELVLKKLRSRVKISVRPISAYVRVVDFYDGLASIGKDKIQSK